MLSHSGRAALCFLASASLGALALPAKAAPHLLLDAATGDVLDAQDATQSWFPASTAKLMTTYVALDAVASGRMSLNTPLLVSPRAASMAPSKMGFRPGTQVTLDNALKMLMVKSANDIAVTIAEGVSGSVEAFADEMNAAAAKLGMRESRFSNPNGLPDPRQVSSARDLAILARALLQRFPERADLFDIGALRLGRKIIPTHNALLGRYPGADGMKTGFTCSAGFNVVATASRGGRRLIAVVLGAPSASARTAKAVSLFERGFAGRTSGAGSVDSLSSAGVTEAPDMRSGVCGNRRKATAEYMASIEETAIPLKADYAQALTNQPERSFLAFGAASAPQTLRYNEVLAMPRPIFTPIDVHIGPVPGWTGPVAHAIDYSGPTEPATATAFAAAAKTGENSPLEPSADALPMKRAAAKPQKGAKLAHAAAAARQVKPAPAPKPAKAAAKPQVKAKIAALPKHKPAPAAKAKPDHKKNAKKAGAD